MAELAELGGGRVRHVHSLGAATVALPPLTIGATFFSNMAVRQEPYDGFWHADHYVSGEPALFVIDAVMLQSSAGILAFDGPTGRFVSSESLHLTQPGLHGYRTGAEAVTLLSGRPEAVDAVALSLLAPMAENLFHWMVDGVARLGVVPENYLRAAGVLLVPMPAVERFPGLLSRLPLPPGLTVRPVRDGESLRIRTLIQPGSVSLGLAYHPCLAVALRSMVRGPAAADTPLPRRFYVDRRGSAARRLVNETDLVTALAQLGIPAIVLEDLPLAAQIDLFAQAELVVAPHGAGLTHIAFAPPGCRVLELLMDSYVHFAFRALAALCGLRYDCVIGRTIGPWRSALTSDVQTSTWQVSIPHVVAAVMHLG